MIRITLLCLFALLGMHSTWAAQTSLDSIVAIVDEGIITKRELENRIELVTIDFRQSKRKLPNKDALRRQVLEALISDSLLLQQSANRGIQVTDSQLNQTMQNMAKQNNMNLSNFRQTLIADGLVYEKYREAVRKELIISTLRRQYGQRNATVSEAEVDDFIKRSGDQNTNFEYLLSHILIAVPDAASPDKVSKAQADADEILKKLDQGEEFSHLANTFSAGGSALQGGDLGWRKKAEIPSLFTTEVLKMIPGEYVGPIRSASGFHIVYLQDRRDVEQRITQQTRSRHILLKSNELISEDDVKNRLLEFRKRILEGEQFDRFARLYSVDYGSGAKGGDLGWTDPGTMVREYETVTNQLQPGELSEPFRSQFGWHLVELTGRRSVDETVETKRKKIQFQLLRQKQIEAFDLWKRRLRDEAYVVYPEESV